ncbi:MAG: ATP-binding cassette domain-containing protein [Lachnospiraceae bacterium]
MSPINKKNDTALTLRSVTKSYGGQPVLSDLSLKFSSGTFDRLMAPSGNGKTTLFRLILGLEKPDSGAILFGTPAENPGNNDIKASSGTVSKSDPGRIREVVARDFRRFSGKPSSGRLYRH